MSCHSRFIPLAITVVGILTLVAQSPLPTPQRARYLWLVNSGRSGTKAVAQIPPPDGFIRVSVEHLSFGDWLRGLPLKASTQVHLFDGRLKANQSAQYAVLDLDVGRQDLQQCADAVMRLRGEFLFSKQDFDHLHFNFTSGDKAPYWKWREGYRPKLNLLRTHASWEKTSAPDPSYTSFREYMDLVFRYAGTASLSRELHPVRILQDIEPGDVFIHGGSPGHAVIVIDVAHDSTGKKVFLLAQSYMPAQEMHVLRNPMNQSRSPWYSASDGAYLKTPEWDFAWSELKRF